MGQLVVKHPDDGHLLGFFLDRRELSVGGDRMPQGVSMESARAAAFGTCLPGSGGDRIQPTIAENNSTKAAGIRPNELSKPRNRKLWDYSNWGLW